MLHACKRCSQDIIADKLQLLPGPCSSICIHCSNQRLERCCVCDAQSLHLHSRQSAGNREPKEGSYIKSVCFSAC